MPRCDQRRALLRAQNPNDCRPKEAVSPDDNDAVHKDLSRKRLASQTHGMNVVRSSADEMTIAPSVRVAPANARPNPASQTAHPRVRNMGRMGADANIRIVPATE